MKVSTERLPQSQVLLQIEVEDDRLQRAMDSAYRRLAAKVKIPGFRPGKVPRNVLERHLGEDAIRQEAIDRLMPEVYKEALLQEEIEPVDRAEYELVTEQPLVAKFTVPVKPRVDLGEYSDLRLAREAVVVEPERVQESLEALRHRYATLEPIARPIQWGDIVRADVHANVEDRPLVNEDDAEFQLAEGRTISLPGFSIALLGHQKGDEFEFDLSIGDDATDERLRGKQAHYRVRIKEVKEEVLPEPDDDFARQVGEGFPSLTALRTRVEDDLRQALEKEAEHQYHERALDALVSRAEVEFPPVLVEREAERLLREQSGAGRGRQTGERAAREELDRYLHQVGKSEEELREELRPVAETRLRRSLVLSELAEAEHILVSDGDVEAEIDRLASGAASSADDVRRLFSSDAGKESIRRTLMTQKTLERLAEIVSANGAIAEDGEASASETE